MRKTLIPVILAILMAISAAPSARPQGSRVYDLGNSYPFGSWAELHSINNFNVAVGLGDVSGDVRMVGVRLPGTNPASWFESGLSSDDDRGIAFEGMAISDTGLIVGSVRDETGNARAYAWGRNYPGIDLGALPGSLASVALNVNHLGTLIVGLSFYGPSGATPVAWTPELRWRNGHPTLTWEIHELPKGGLDQTGQVWDGVTLKFWGAWGVNDRGQIVGDAWSSDYDEIAVVWSPSRGSHGWEIQRLPHLSASGGVDHLYTEALSINDQGDIAGDVSLEDGWSADLPAVWRQAPRRLQAWELTELATLSGSRDGWQVAFCINDRGDVVGYSSYADGIPLAARWRINAPGSAYELGFPAGDWSVAYGVNDLGIAVGTYGIGDGEFPVAVKFR